MASDAQQERERTPILDSFIRMFVDAGPRQLRSRVVDFAAKWGPISTMSGEGQFFGGNGLGSDERYWQSGPDRQRWRESLSPRLIQEARTEPVVAGVHYEVDWDSHKVRWLRDPSVQWGRETARALDLAFGVGEPRWEPLWIWKLLAVRLRVLREIGLGLSTPDGWVSGAAWNTVGVFDAAGRREGDRDDARSLIDELLQLSRLSSRLSWSRGAALSSRLGVSLAPPRGPVSGVPEWTLFQLLVAELLDILESENGRYARCSKCLRWVLNTRDDYAKSTGLCRPCQDDRTYRNREESRKKKSKKRPGTPTNTPTEMNYDDSVGSDDA